MGFFKPALNKESTYIGMAVGAKTQNANEGAATSNIPKSTIAGKILSLSDMHGNDLRLRVQ